MYEDKIFKEDFKAFKKQSINIANDFEYGNDVKKSIENAKSVAEINRILRTARDKKFG